MLSGSITRTRSMESYSRRFKTRKIRSKHRTDGASAFNTCTARGRLLLLDPARGEEKLRESSGNTIAWWWSLQFSVEASPSTTTTQEVLERGRAVLGEGCGSPPTSPLFIGGRECWKYALEAIIKWLLLYLLVHDNCLSFML